MSTPFVFFENVYNDDRLKSDVTLVTPNILYERGLKNIYDPNNENVMFDALSNLVCAYSKQFAVHTVSILYIRENIINIIARTIHEFPSNLNPEKIFTRFIYYSTLLDQTQTGSPLRKLIFSTVKDMHTFINKIWKKSTDIDFVMALKNPGFQSSAGSYDIDISNIYSSIDVDRAKIVKYRGHQNNIIVLGLLAARQSPYGELLFVLYLYLVFSLTI